MVRSEIMRGRYRESFSRPVPFIPARVTPVTFRLQDVLHTFQKGHRIMVQVQSSLFPAFDRNPQKFVPNIYQADATDFVKATQRVRERASRARDASGAAYDLIVIGSGIGGLTVASLMARLRGWRVLVLERHFRLGGFTHTFSRPGGLSWDVGLHYVGEMAPGAMPRRLFDLVTGGAVEWQKMATPFEKFVYPDFTFEVPPDLRAYRDALSARFPAERAGIQQYFKELRAAAGWYGTRLVADALPPALGVPLRALTRRRESQALATTRTWLDRLFRDPRLKAVLASQWGDYGLPPSQSAFAIHALVTSSYFKGGYYPVGGAGTIARAVVPIVEARGGRCLSSHQVTEIVVDGGRAAGVKVLAGRGHNQTEQQFSAPNIVSDAGAYTTFCRLLPPEVPLPFREGLERLAAGPSMVTVYLGLKESPAKLGFRGENHWIYAGYDHDEAFAQRHLLLEGQPTMCYLSLQSLKDPRARTHAAQIIAFLDYSRVEAFKDQPWRHRGEAYEALKQRIADGLLAFVEQRHPGFRELVSYTEVSTPLTVENFTGHLRGSVYGVPATPERFRLPYLRVRTPIPNLYVTGADVGSLGIVGALMGGIATSGRLLGGLGFFRIMGAARR